MSLALQGPTCDEIKVDLKQIFALNDDKDTESLEMDKLLSTDDDLTQQKFKKIETNLAKYVTLDQTQHARKS